MGRYRQREKRTARERDSYPAPLPDQRTRTKAEEAESAAGAEGPRRTAQSRAQTRLVRKRETLTPPRRAWGFGKRTSSCPTPRRPLPCGLLPAGSRDLGSRGAALPILPQPPGHLGLARRVPLGRHVARCKALQPEGSDGCRPTRPAAASCSQRRPPRIGRRHQAWAGPGGCLRPASPGPRAEAPRAPVTGVRPWRERERGRRFPSLLQRVCAPRGDRADRAWLSPPPPPARPPARPRAREGLALSAQGVLNARGWSESARSVPAKCMGSHLPLNPQGGPGALTEEITAYRNCSHISGPRGRSHTRQGGSDS